MVKIEFEKLIQKVFDGLATEEECRQVEYLLNESEECRVVYCKHTRLLALIKSRAQGLRSLTNPTPIIPLETLREAQKKRFFKASLLSAVALILVLAVMSFIYLRPQPSGLEFAIAPGTKYSLSHGAETRLEGMKMEVGSEVTMTSGSMELVFASGVKSIVEAPAQLKLVAEDELQLKYGKAWFEVPKEAIGFTVHSADSRIVDLGTEFGVVSSPLKEDECHVMKGKVIVYGHSQLGQSRTLTKGEGVRVTSTGRLSAIAAQESKFLKALPKALKYVHWSFDSMDEGGFTCDSSYTSLSDSKLNLEGSQRSEDARAQGKFGQALQFSAKGDHLISDWEGLAGGGPRTVAFWLHSGKGGKSSYYSLLGWGERLLSFEKQNCYLLFVEFTEVGDFILSLTTGSVVVEVSERVRCNEWVHVTCVYSGEVDQQGLPVMKFYFNGEIVECESRVNMRGKVTTGVDTITDSHRSNPFSVGSSIEPRPNFDFPPGMKLDELYIINGELDVSQVKELYKNNKLTP